jgi:hypothetical protein
VLLVYSESLLSNNLNNHSGLFFRILHYPRVYRFDLKEAKYWWLPWIYTEKRNFFS